MQIRKHQQLYSKALSIYRNAATVSLNSAQLLEKLMLPEKLLHSSVPYVNHHVQKVHCYLCKHLDL